MDDQIDRREFLKLASIGGVVFVSTLSNQHSAQAFSPKKDFFFVQLSDTHWGFDGKKVNPDAKGTLPKAIKELQGLEQKPEFIVFTGDLTQISDDASVRKQRMKEFKDIVSELSSFKVLFMPGEHDASLDNGEMYKEFFGATHYTWDHKGVHFIVIDNVSDPGGIIGKTQLQWLEDDLKLQKPDANIVVFTHRPLFDLYPQWDWTTKDGDAAIKLLMPFKNVTVFYGHIHQEHHHFTGHIAHHSAKSLMLPMPPAGSVPKREPILWVANEPYKGLGFREVKSLTKNRTFTIEEFGINAGTT
jgi:3',5'-cyclic AMP phosphodiesterase CpdA